MPRFKLIIEYDGSPFAGWQRQKNGLSVQEAIETALKALSGEGVSIGGAGRTDGRGLRGSQRIGVLRRSLARHHRAFRAKRFVYS